MKLDISLLHDRIIEKYSLESIHVKRKIMYNIIIIFFSIIISSILLTNIMIHSNQTTENPIFYITIIIMLFVNLYLILRGITIQIVPVYTLVVGSSLWTYFSKVPGDSDIIVIAIFSFTLMIWLFISYRWWHMLIHLINTLFVIIIRLRVIFQANEQGILSPNQYMATISAYIFLVGITIFGIIIYFIMEREINYTSSEIEDKRRNKKMFEDLLTIVDLDQKETAIKEKSYLEGFFDPLTMCLNRLAFTKFFMVSNQSTYKNLKFYLVYIDLNGLKFVNDQYGHEKGDEYLHMLIKAIKGVERPGDVIYRIGGDEFVLISVHRKFIQLENDLIKANHVLSKIFEFKNFKGSFSYGISHSDEVDNWNISDLCMIADERMYQMKKSAQNNVEYGV